MSEAYDNPLTPEQTPSAKPDLTIMPGSISPVKASAYESFLADIPNADYARDLEQSDSRERRELLAQPTGAILLFHLVDKTGYIPHVSDLIFEAIMKGKDKSNTLSEAVDKEEAKIHHLTALRKEEIRTGELILEGEEYHSGPNGGLDIDAIEDLLDRTDVFLAKSQLLALLAGIHEEERSNPAVAKVMDAERILRILIDNEVSD